MKKLISALVVGLTACFSTNYVAAQVSCEPIFPTQNDSVTIFYDANLGNAALKNVSPIYIHTGVITNLSTGPSDWKHVATTWASTTAAAQMTLVSPNLWKKKIDIKTYFGIPAGETVLKLAFVFRNASGSVVGRASDGSDIFYEIFPDDGLLRTRFLAPADPFLIAQTGQNITVKAAANEVADLKLFDNLAFVFQKTGAETLDFSLPTAAGFHEITFVATTATQTDTASFSYLVPGSPTVENPPAGTELGATILSNSSLRLSLFAPGKQQVWVIGAFSNWQPTPSFQMKKSVDGNTWWLDLTSLPPGQPVQYQYVVDGNLKIADPLSTLILDAGNDPWIPALTYPNPPVYPTGKTSGHVSQITPGAAPFNWTTANFQKPKKTDLVIYELLVRDFLARHDYQTMLDTLDYLQNLGINAIEFMPVNEFDGNINWGYGPSFHMALDKYYGPADALKTLIDECHARGIAVILDVVFNQATGDSPLAKLYWDAANNRPAANNPWLNATATHPFSVFNDFNHESFATKNYVDRCLKYWIDEFRVDGYRYDLSKGFTQKNSGSDVGLWGQLDAVRVLILKHYGDVCWAKDPGFFNILEHFADNTEEKQLSDYGFMLWGNMWGSYKEAALGFAGGANDLSWGVWKNRGWAAPNLVTYMESHDEERHAVECKNFGNSSNASHNVKNSAIAMKRLEATAAMFYTLPGPKMLWQFGEMGYDFSINTCEDLTINNACRTSPKPIKWNYLTETPRRHLHDVVSALIKLRISEPIFETETFNLSIGQGVVKSFKLNSPTSNALVAANFDVNSKSVGLNFQHTGKWFEFFTGDSLNLTSTSQTFTFQPGEYRIYLDKKVVSPTVSTRFENSVFEEISLFPNPAGDQFALHFSMKTASRVRLELVDFTGKRVADFGETAFAEGENLIENDLPDSLPNGLHFLKMTAENGSVVLKKMMVIR